MSCAHALKYHSVTTAIKLHHLVTMVTKSVGGRHNGGGWGLRKGGKRADVAEGLTVFLQFCFYSVINNYLIHPLSIQNAHKILCLQFFSLKRTLKCFVGQSLSRRDLHEGNYAPQCSAHRDARAHWCWFELKNMAADRRALCSGWATVLTNWKESSLLR